MVRSSTLTEEPLVNDIEHTDTVCTVGVTNFQVNINPAGMALIKSIDPTAILLERYHQMSFIAGAMHHAGVLKYELSTLEGFCKLWEWMCREADEGSYAYGRVHHLLGQGLPYEVDVKEDSPLVGWFNVMKGVSNG